MDFYRYDGGWNWHACVAFLIPVSVLLPGLAQSITPDSVHVKEGIPNLYSFSWSFGILM
jgi:NCS1 family nucleobase:cation symporter-1